MKLKSFQSFSIINESKDNEIIENVKQIVMPLIDEGFEMTHENQGAGYYRFEIIYDVSLGMDYKAIGQKHEDGEIETQESIDEATNDFVKSLEKSIVMLKLLPEINDRIFDAFSESHDVTFGVETCSLMITIDKK